MTYPLPFTDRARKVMQLANQEAGRLSHEHIGTEHILLGLIREGSGVTPGVFKAAHYDLGIIRTQVGELAKSEPSTSRLGRLSSTPGVKKALDYAEEEAHSFRHGFVGRIHILLGLIRERDGIAAAVLINLGLETERLRTEIEDFDFCDQP